MKKTIISAIFLIAAAILSDAQQPWQKITDPKTSEIAGNFKSPPAEYGMILWWGWDGPMTDTVIRRDLDRIKEMGFQGVMIEAGYGMSAKYLSPEWFSLVKLAVYEAKQRGMRVWIEDEGKYPSGFAGGKFSNERPDLKMQGLVVTERINPGAGEKITRKLPYYTLSAVAYNNEDKSDKIIDISSGELNWVVPEGSWQIFLAGYRFRSSVTRSVNNLSRGKDTTASLMDYLNPLATRQFLDWTHEQYKKYFGSEFGKTFMGFMGDEPDFAYMPWTPDILEEFKSRKGYDIKPFLASFFVPQLSDEEKRMKADYWDVWSSLFGENFFKVQADWCRENNIEYIVHLNHEDQMPGLVKSSGDFFRNMRYVGVPGVDAIWSQIWMDHVADYPKLASSASHLFGRPRAFTESFAAYTYRPSVPQAKWVIDYQLVRGINFVQIMFMSASTTRTQPAVPPANASARPANQAAPRPSFFLTDTFPPVAHYINRASYLLSQGKPAAKIGIYFPTMSMWYGDNESNTSVLDIARQLTENQKDFDFVDEQALTSILTLENRTLKNLSGESYRALIIPSISVISDAALLRLQEFAASGGKVIFIGNLPSLVVDKSFVTAAKPSDLTWAMHEETGKLTSAIFEALPEPDFKTDKTVPQLKYLHREWKDADLYFIFNEGKEPQSLNISFPGKSKKQIWDATTGQILKMKGSSFSFEPWETKFVIIKK
ncbi:MAG: glycosyl hydrolase [Bacteroidia bacterium]|nr:glycosyl hydrolase [Bacteroidia bacterium]